MIVHPSLHLLLLLFLVTNASPYPTVIQDGADNNNNTQLSTQSIQISNISQPSGTPTHFQLNHSRLCTNQSAYLTIEGRPTTPPYKRLVDFILAKLQALNDTTVTIRERQILNIEQEVIKLNNELLPGVVLTSLCDVLSTLAHSQDIDVIHTQKVNELNQTILGVMETYNYTAHRIKKSDEQRLLAELMFNYEKEVRPVLKASEPVELKIGLTLNQIDVVSTCALAF